MDILKLTDHLAGLNDTEKFLKEFLREHSEYQTAVICLSDSQESDYDRLMRMLGNKWNREFPELPFFC